MASPMPSLRLYQFIRVDIAGFEDSVQRYLVKHKIATEGRVWAKISGIDQMFGCEDMILCYDDDDVIIQRW